MRSENSLTACSHSVRGFVAEEVIDELNEVVGLGDGFVGDAGSGLVEHGALGSLEDDVVARIAFVELRFDFAVEVVFFVLGFPVAVGEVKGVDQGAVDSNVDAACALDRELRNEGEMELFSAIGEEFGEGVADLGFVVEVELSDLVEGGVIVLYGGVGRLEC